jgi:ribulose-phosphate 3-epimerase
MIEIIPGILEKEWSEIERKIKLVAPYVSWVQIDIADNTLVTNITFLDFDKNTFAQIPDWDIMQKNLSFEAHLMVANPEKYIHPLVDAGFKRLIAHIEANDPRRFLDTAHYESVEVGIAIDGTTELEQIEPFLEEVDVVLVMTIEAGFSGQPFLPETLEKVKSIRRNVPDLSVEVDGGIDDKTARLVKESGATRLVSTTYLFKSPREISQAIERLKKV